jgi:hypothetical protein
MCLYENHFTEKMVRILDLDRIVLFVKGHQQ